jgi:DNA-binding NarL/FixJ family response regulator
MPKDGVEAPARGHCGLRNARRAHQAVHDESYSNHQRRDSPGMPGWNVSRTTMRILLVDDHALVRAGIRALVAEMPHITSVIEAENGREALAAVAEHKPDVVLMDITMPHMNGFEATARILKKSPFTRVIILSMHQSEELVLSAFEAGASGYLLKAGLVDELQEALVAVARGTMYVSPALQKMFDDWQQQRGERTGPFGPMQVLTARQREVLRLIGEGKSNRQIADALGIGVKTVESHRTELMKRLDIHDVAGLVRYAIRHGFVSLD